MREQELPEALRGLWVGVGASVQCFSVMLDALQEEGIARSVVSGLVCEAVRRVCQ